MNTKLTMTALLVSSTLVMAALAAFPAMNSAVFATTDDDQGHDYEKHNENPGQSKDPEQKNHGCEKGVDSQGWVSSGENCYHPG
jgi:hypothetical protein